MTAEPLDFSKLSLEQRALLEQRLKQRAEAKKRTQAPLTQRRHGAQAPLSFAQQRLWFLYCLEPRSPFYNSPISLRLQGTLDVDALRQALAALSDRHEILRTRFDAVGGEPFQIVDAQHSLEVPLVDCAAPDATSREAEVRRRVRAFIRQPFDLKQEHPFRAILYRLGTDDHVLLLVLHHIASDGWSQRVLYQDLAAFYTALRATQSPELPPILQYADYAIWQREQLEVGSLDRQLDYWKEQLSNSPPSLELPTDYSRPATLSLEGGYVGVTLPPALIQRLKRLSLQADTTLFVTLLVGFQVLLHRYSGMEDIVVGTPVAGRTHPDLERMIGFFVNTLALRARFVPTLTLWELLRQSRETLLGATANQDIPFERVVEALRVERSLSHSPIFQVMFQFNSAPPATLTLPELTTTPFLVAKGTTQFDLSLSLFAQDEWVTGWIEYSTDLFEEATIRRFVSHYEQVLNTLAVNPRCRVVSAPLLSAQERNQLLIEWNQSRRPLPAYRTLHEIVEEQVARYPDHIAVEYEGEQVNYRELNRRANQVAHFLRARKLEPGAVVGVYLERSIDFIVALLGVLKAGGVYLPIDATYPKERIEYMLQDARVRYLVTHRSLGSLPSFHIPIVIQLDEDAAMRAQGEPDNPGLSLQPEMLAYIIYTSGSTGGPKGVMISHRSLLSYFEGYCAQFEVQPGERILQMAALGFDTATEEIFMALTRGATLVLRTPDMLEPSTFVACCRDWQLNVIDLPTSYWHHLIAAGVVARFNDCAALRLVLLGSEEASLEHLQVWQSEVKPSIRLFNLYGPTECTIVSIATELDPMVAYRKVPIGRPIPNMRSYILDSEMQPVPIGVAGELYIGGPGLARGYLHQPARTAQNFVPDPHSGEAGARLYRTGDRARYLPDGTLEFLGRADEQIKVRGFRIEPGEIEEILRQNSEVQQAVVIRREDTVGDPRLVAYLVRHSDHEGLPDLHERLLALLRARLPYYMIPSALVELDALPLTPNGKLARAALPAPMLTPAHAAGEGIPQTPTEEMLVAIWGEVLEVEHIGTCDSFFELGGHSLLATQVIARVQEAFGISLSLRSLFEAPTIASFAVLLEEALGEGIHEMAGYQPTPAPREEGEEHPLSFAQQRLWFLSQMEEGNVAYNLPGGWRLRGPLDAAALESALEQIVARHEILRTHYPTLDGEPRQVVVPPGPVSFSMLDLSSWEPAQQNKEIKRLGEEDVLRPFDLSTGPLLRASLLRLRPDEHVLLLNIHHIASDAWSDQIFFAELSAYYAAYQEGRPAFLPELPLQYADYARWQRTWLQGALLERQLAYWKSQLHQAPAYLALPTDYPRPARQSHQGAYQSFDIEPTVFDALQRLSRQSSTTLFMTLLAAWAGILQRWSGQEDIVIGTPISGRNRTSLEGLIGFFVNTLPLRLNLAGNPTFRTLLGRVRQVALEGYAHQDLPFERLVEVLHIERSLSHSPLFQISFTYRRLSPREDILPGIQAERLEVQTTSAKFDLQLALFEQGGCLSGSLTYRTDLFKAATITRWIGHFQCFLCAITEVPDVPIQMVEILTPEERALLLAGWGDHPKPLPETTIPSYFEEQVARTPEATALMDGMRPLSYAELDRQANQLAHQLQQWGVGPEMRVAFCLTRRAEAVIAILGILKAGAAYLPLDPAYPAARLAWLLSDGQAELILTEETTRALVPDVGACRVVEWESLSLDSLPDTAPPRCITGSQLAYLIYTSGSTGAPKGVAITHRNAISLLEWARHHFLPDELQGVLASSSLCFDLSVFELFAPLTTGGSVILAQNLLHLPTLPAATLVTLVNTVPSVLTELLRGYSLPSTVQTVNLAGEPLPEALAQQLHAIPHIRRVLNLYGPSEDTTYSTWANVVPEQPITIGQPVTNTRAYVLDRFLQPVPIGVAGELFLGGEGLARGYLGQPARTAERFLPDPFSSSPGARLYRSGDLVRWLPSGTLDFLGRTDQQLKLRGFRIEPGEIEYALRAHPAVREALVLLRPTPSGERQLATFLVVTQPAPAPSALRAHLHALLPAPLIPSAWFFLDAFPLSPNGKLDRQALLALDPAPAPEDFHLPLSPTEQRLARLWADLLDRPAIGRFDDFFLLGGHSLLAIRVVARVRTLFGVELPIARLFEAPTLAGLAEVIDSLGETKGQALSIPLADRSGPLALSFAQQRLWFLEQLLPGTGSYNVPLTWRLDGPLDVTALHQSLEALIQRHEVLRICFVMVEGEPQVQLAEVKLALPLEVLEGLSPQAQADALARRQQEEAEHPFDLSRAPLLRARLLRLHPTRHVLLLTLHHIVTDGWSLPIIGQELATLYDAFQNGYSPVLDPLPVQYADYARWQREWLQGPHLDRHLDYWGRHLASLTPLLLPTDSPRPVSRSTRGASCARPLDAALLARLSAFCQEERVTPFMALLATFQILLSRYTNEGDIAVGTPIANRARPELEGLIGFFVNTLVMRTDLSGHPTFREALRRVRRVTLDAYEHQELPFELLVERLNPERAMSHTPLFQVMFVHRTESSLSQPFGALTVEPIPAPSNTAKFDLTLSVSEREDELYCGIEYSTELFEAVTAERMIGHFEQLLQGLLAHPDREVTRLSLLTSQEEEQLREWSRPAQEIAPATVPALFEEQVARTPTHIALMDDRGALTFAELNAQANQLAHHLRALGIRPGMRVALWMERSSALITAMLATLKVGASYLPLDVAYPAERLSWLLRDSEASLLLVQPDLAVEQLGESARHLRQLPLDPSWQRFAEEPASNLPPAAWPASEMYTMYTSGSTGQPKGVMVPHHAVVRLVHDRSYLAPTPQDRFLQLAPTGFDASTFEIWGALLNGATLVLPPARLPTLDEIAEWLVRYKITILWLTAELFHQMVETHPSALASVRHVLTGGDVVSADPIRRLSAVAPNTSLYNGYGPTENTTFSAVFAVPRTDEWGPTVPIGRPVANTRAYVLDRFLQPVPIGVAGELFLGGEGLARGYLGRPDLTAEKFVPDPFSRSPGARLYRSGDLVRWLPSGTLDFLGRTDQQLKLRGFRIEPGEIEHALRAHPAVREALVLLRPTPSGERQLAAFLVVTQPAPAPSALRAHLHALLPAFLIPAAWFFLDAFPLSPNGKIDRQALLALDPAPSPEDFHLPLSPTEQRLAHLWADLLDRPVIGRFDDFFLLGGHSLLAVRAQAALEKEWGQQLPLSLLFQRPTLAEWAEALDTLAPRAREATEAETEGRIVTLQAEGQEQPLFLVHPASGTVTCYTALAQVMGAERPIYGLHAQGLDGSEGPLTDLEAMSASYVRAIRTYQPHGPYLLGGWSLGGLIAFEMAQQLTRAGEDVSLVALIDTRPPPYYAELEVGDVTTLMTQPGFQLPPMDTTSRQRFEALFEANLDAVRHYRAEQYDGNLVLFEAAESVQADTSVGWQPYSTRPMAVYQTPGNHYTLLYQPALDSLASSLRACLRTLAPSLPGNPRGEQHLP